MLHESFPRTACKLYDVVARSTNRVDVRRAPREKTSIEAVSSAVVAASSGNKLGIYMTNEMRKRVHAARVRAADKTTWIVHPHVRKQPQPTESLLQASA